MHILWIQNRAQYYGGAERYVTQTVSELNKRGCANSLVYAPNFSPDEDFVEHFDHSEAFASAKEQIGRIQPDVIYIHQLSNYEYLNEILSTGVPAVRFYHDHRLFCLRQHKITFPDRKPCTRKVSTNCYWRCMFGAKKSNSPFKLGFSRLEPLYAEQAENRKLQAHIVGSQYMAKQLQIHDFSPQKIWVMPLYASTDTTNHHAQDQNQSLLYVGTLTRGKGLDILLRALSRVAQPWQLNVVGSGPQEAEFKQLARSLNLESSVRFIGRLSSEEVKEYYLRSKFVVMPARAPETFALVGPEAFSFGKPVIATDIGGVREWLEPGENGLSVPPNDPAALADAITTLLDDPAMVEKFGENARLTFEAKFTPQKHVDSLLSLFEKLIQSQDESPVESDTSWGRFTAFGDAAVERDITQLVHEVSQAIGASLKSENIGFKALVMLGGYGRGEGGVVTKNGSLYPHNNFDFMLIADRTDARTLGIVDEKLRPLLAGFEKQTEIGMDLSVISTRRLKNASNLVIWYDMRFGHKTLLGDASFVPGLRRFKRETIPSADIRNLLVNRGTLFVINQLILNKPSLDERDRRTVIKHAIKGIIGYGDALLYYHGRYHWSYKEKQRRMRVLESVDEDFRHLYEEAMNFRFRPDYESYAQIDLAQWMEGLQRLLANVHLDCERSRLNQSDLDWGNYIGAALNKLLFINWYKPRQLLKFSRNLLSGPKFTAGLSLKSATCRLGGYREMLSIFFPVIAYDLPNPEDREFIKQCLVAASTSTDDLRVAYLKCWGVHGDTNFRQVLDQLGLSLEGAQA